MEERREWGALQDGVETAARGAGSGAEALWVSMDHGGATGVNLGRGPRKQPPSPKSQPRSGGRTLAPGASPGTFKETIVQAPEGSYRFSIPDDLRRGLWLCRRSAAHQTEDSPT